jgi:hypothetical protein
VRALVRLDDDFDEKLMLAYAQNASASQVETIVRGCRRCVGRRRGQRAPVRRTRVQLEL